jgi:hypothetical protein
MKNPAAVSLGALGGRARARALTKERRLEIAKIASNAARIARRQKALDLDGKDGMVPA